MDALKVLGVFNYGLVLLYGLFLSIAIAGGCENRRQQIFTLLLCPAFLLIQTPCWLLLGVVTAKRLYPLIVHLPLALAMIFGLKKPVGITLVSICTAYLCCQLPRFGSIAVTALTGRPLAGEAAYTILIVPIYFLLWRFFAPAAYNAMTDSRHSLLLFGSLPVFYYIFDYATVIYTDLLYEGNRTLVEVIPSVLVLFYVAFLTAYRHQLQQRSQSQLQSSLLSTQLKQAEAEMSSLRQADAQSAIYRHDMRHHLSAIDSLLTAGKPDQAREYIRGVQSSIESVTPRRFCQNELVNLICSSFTDRGERAGVSLSVSADLPGSLAIPDVELCALFSNALENAINAAEAMEEGRRWVSCTCAIRAGKFLIEVKNPYRGDVVMRDSLPVSDRKEHGYGCSSIQTITERNRGLCEFRAERGVFTLRVVLPVRSG